MSDLDIARMVADDLECYFRWRGPHLPAPVYTLALWTDSHHGNFQISFGTEPDFERFSKSAAPSAPGDGSWGPTSARWNSGAWELVFEEFISSRTDQALAPLKAIVNDLDVDRDEATLCGAWHRWREIGFKAIELTRVPVEVPAAQDMLFFAESGQGTPGARAHWMLRNVEPEMFHRVFPQWRRLAALARQAQADAELMARARQAISRWKAGGMGSGETYDPFSAELTSALVACGLGWLHLAEGKDPLQLALTIAYATTPIVPAPCGLGYPYESYMTA